MGLPKFVGGWMGSLPQNFVIRGEPPVVSSLSIDMNSLLYLAFGRGMGMQPKQIVTYDPKTRQKTITYNINDKDLVEQRKILASMGSHAFEQAMRNLFAILVNALLATYPRDTLILAVDGVAPMGKQVTQRDRRFRGVLDEIIAKTFDFSGFTPGTDVMQEIDKRIYLWLSQNKDKKVLRTNANGVTEEVPLLPAVVIYSSHMQPGEGEQKIMDFYREGRLRTEVPINESRGYHVLMGLDADLMVLAANCGVRDILLAFNNEILPMKGELKVDDLPDLGSASKGMLKFYDINVFRRVVASKMGYSIPDEVTNEYMETNIQLRQAMDDFVFVLSLAGNDFLPGQPALADIAMGVEPLLEAYRKTNLPLTVAVETARDILWSNVAVFFRNLYPSEGSLIYTRTLRKYKYPFKMAEAAVITTDSGVQSLDYNKFRAMWYNRVFSPRDESMRSFVDGLLSAIGSSSDKILGLTPEHMQTSMKAMVTDYLDGLSWVFHYYTRGPKAISEWFFYKYRYTPLLFDLAQATPSVGRTILLGEYQRKPTDMQMHCLHQMLNVLPVASKIQANQSIRGWMTYEGPLADLNPINVAMDPEGVDEERHGVCLLPFPDPLRVMELVGQTNITPDILVKLRPIEAHEWIISETEKRDRINREVQLCKRRFSMPHGDRGQRVTTYQVGGKKGKHEHRGHGGSHGSNHGGHKHAGHAHGSKVGHVIYDSTQPSTKLMQPIVHGEMQPGQPGQGGPSGHGGHGSHGSRGRDGRGGSGSGGSGSQSKVVLQGPETVDSYRRQKPPSLPGPKHPPNNNLDFRPSVIGPQATTQPQQAQQVPVVIVPGPKPTTMTVSATPSADAGSIGGSSSGRGGGRGGRGGRGSRGKMSRGSYGGPSGGYGGAGGGPGERGNREGGQFVVSTATTAMTPMTPAPMVPAPMTVAPTPIQQSSTQQTATQPTSVLRFKPPE